mgnify:CR=1 FL=1
MIFARRWANFPVGCDLVFPQHGNFCDVRSTWTCQRIVPTSIVAPRAAFACVHPSSVSGWRSSSRNTFFRASFEPAKQPPNLATDPAANLCRRGCRSLHRLTTHHLACQDRKKRMRAPRCSVVGRDSLRGLLSTPIIRSGKHETSPALHPSHRQSWLT